MSPPRLLFLVTEDWYFCSHRMDLAKAAQKAGFEIHVATRISQHEAAIRAAGFVLHEVNLDRGIGNPLREIAVLVGLLRRVRPDILHNVALKPAVFGSLAARLTGVDRLINAVSGLGYVFINRGGVAGLLRPLFIAAFRFLFGGANRHVIVQNAYDKAFFDALVEPARVHLIRGAGIDVEKFIPFPEPPGPPLAAAVSRLLWDKGIGELVEAARLLKARGVNLRIALVGKPDPANPRTIAEEEVRRWVAEGLVEWWGFKDDVREVWRQAHIAVLPSYREGLPKALLEASACGRPMVATDVPGCNELVRNDDNGLLVPVREAPPLADALERLANDPHLRARLGRRARERAEQEFSSRQVIAPHLELYRALKPL
ncbi:glycosyltransferase family 4 protein [Telmatospirillum siberiense]|uniref:Glycosyltransferase family 1 protein n=1 Tax=Telmatospirillum siberiense TaxID=382514 RepID=A0A2N3PT02_9PROT|nr:glycosyltransferase family 4 protein [Telmatospirillum siberiense]PKU23540.1 glycosyltransferase family 1 protein [Telmatospirillum siberiense]